MNRTLGLGRRAWPRVTALAIALTLSLRTGGADKGRLLAQAFSEPSPSNYVAIVNGRSWPLNFRPYCHNAKPNPRAPCPFSDRLPDVPAKLMGNSSQIVANMSAHRNLDVGLGGAASMAVYLAKATDPLVTVFCSTYCYEKSRTAPVRIRIPRAARSEPGLCTGRGSDCLMGIIQPDGTEYDLYGMNGGRNYDGAATLVATGLAWESIVRDNSVDPCGSSLRYPGNGGGCVNNGQFYASYADSIRVAEIKAGIIPHALQIGLACGGSPWGNKQVYPGSVNFTCSYLGPPAGARFQLVLTDAQIEGRLSNTIGYDAARTAAWERVVLHATHDYGFFAEPTCGENGDCGRSINFYLEPKTQYTQFGGTWPVSTFDWYSPASGLGGVGVLPEQWRPGGLDWKTALRIVDPCYSLETCST